MTAPDDEIIDGYIDAMVDGDFVEEWAEGSNRAKHLSPDQMLKLIEARDRARASVARRSGGIFRRVRD